MPMGPDIDASNEIDRGADFAKGYDAGCISRDEEISQLKLEIHFLNKRFLKVAQWATTAGWAAKKVLEQLDIGR